MKKILAFAIVLLAAQPVNNTLLAQQSSTNYGIIPQPSQVVEANGSFTLSPTTVIYLSNKNNQSTANYFNGYLKKYVGFSLKVVAVKPFKNYIALQTAYQTNQSADKYVMTSEANAISITGNSDKATFYGVQTLIQLLPTTKLGTVKTIDIPALQVTDEPRFGYRGLHLDCGRHFYSVNFIKKYIDLIALHKMNTFHWHLTEDQGWRIEIKKYPKLTQAGAYRNGTIVGRYPGKSNTAQRYGGYYTQAQVKEIVKYAADRFITVIPEIELPGHSSAAIAAYPELSCFPNRNTPRDLKCPWNGDTTGKQVQQAWGVFDDVFAPTEKTFSFLQDVLDEVMQLFPSKYIHIGGDECPKTYWKQSEFCQQLIKEKNLKDEHGLQSYFIGRIEKYLNSKGRNIIGWDEILEGGLAPNATVMSWRGEEGGIAAAKEKHTVIMTPGNWCYFDHAQTKKEDSVTIGGYTTTQEVYSYEPLPAKLTVDEQKYIIGAQANVWTEYMTNEKKVEYMLLPRLAAMSEVLWSKKENKNWQNFEQRMQQQLQRYALWNTNYYKGTLDK